MIPLFVAPFHPPALIQPSSADLPQLIAQQPESVEIPITVPATQTPPNADLSTPSPQVIEFHYVDPQQQPDLLLTVPPPLTQDNAEELGKPFAVGEPSSNPEQHSRPPLQTTVPTWVVEGLIQSPNAVDLATARLLVTKARSGEKKTFSFDIPISQSPETPAEPEPSDTTDPPAAENPTETAEDPPEVIELIADQQEYDAQQQIVTATGNVVMRFANAVLVADRLRVNIPNRVAVAEGNVVLQRGDQLLRGERFEYYFAQDRGVVFNASGEIYQATTDRDFGSTLPTDLAGVPNQDLNERLSLNQPLQRVTTAQGYEFVVGSSTNPQSSQPAGGFSTPQDPSRPGGIVNRIRFQAEQIEFNSQGWDATNVRLTNDPFSPPELEVRAETAQYRTIAPLVDELRMTNSRVVFDQDNALPVQNRLVFDRRDRQPGVVSFGYDGEERGGLYVERGFNVIDNRFVRWEVKPQYLIQKALFPDAFDSSDDFGDQNPDDTDDGGILSPSVFGLVYDFDATFSERTSFRNLFSLASLDLSNIENTLRTKVFLQHKIGDLSRPYDTRLEYNYRERLFNGSLGFQTVQSSLGAIIVSPVIPLGNSGFNLSYQGSIQNVRAATDQIDILQEQGQIVNNQVTSNLVTLQRYQGAASLNRGFLLWLGKPLPPTPDEGLRYTPTPVLPYLQLGTSVTGVTSLYSSGDSQPSLSGSISLLGQFGHFSRPFLDYTGFTLTFSQAIRGDASPFFFDRFVDTQTLTWGITQQIYGPFRFGVQSIRNLELNTEISTDYFLEYSRRTYKILVRYNPVLEVGSINFRISDFNWTGNPGPFEGTGINPVIQGVTR